MQLNKSGNFSQDSLFPQHILIQEPHSAQNYFPQYKTSTSPPHHEQESINPLEQQLSFVNISSNQLNFYHEYKKIYAVQHHLAHERMRQMAIIRSLTQRIRGLEDKMLDWDGELQKKDQMQDENKSKRFRRPDGQIEKKYKCEVKFCERFYGSEGSLQQHIKLKHPDLYFKMHHDSMEHSTGHRNHSFL